VPVFVSHSECINVEFERPVSVAEATKALRGAEGVVVMDTREPGGYITPVETTGEDAVYVSRIRKDPTVKNGINFWCVADNLRKGAALNAVQVAEVLIRDHLKK
jgi:aspartate-semialdehyde dehydrogenase